MGGVVPPLLNQSLCTNAPTIQRRLHLTLDKRPQTLPQEMKSLANMLVVGGVHEIGALRSCLHISTISGPVDKRACHGGWGVIQPSGMEVVMSDHRLVITDRFWQRWPRCFPARLRIVALRQETTVCFSKLFSGRCAPAPPGEICRMASAHGTARSDAFDAGQPAVWFSGCSRPPVAILIWRSCSSTALLPRFTRKPLGQKGRQAPVHGPLPRRADKEDRGTGGGPGQSGVLPPATRTKPTRAKGWDATDQLSHLRGTARIGAPPTEKPTSSAIGSRISLPEARSIGALPLIVTKPTAAIPLTGISWQPFSHHGTSLLSTGPRNHVKALPR